MSEEKIDYAMQKHTAKRDKEFDELEKACKKQSEMERWKTLRLRFNALYEELAEFKGKAEKRKKLLKIADQNCRDLESKLEGNLTTQSEPDEDATKLTLPFKLDVVKGAHKPDDLFIIGDKNCISFQHYFTLGEKLGKGGFGTVYTAIGLPNNRQHALKVKFSKL